MNKEVGVIPASPGFGVLAVRHAPTLADGLCVGDAEVACTMTAEEAAESMRPLVESCRCACVWSSPRLRCLNPAQVLAGQLGLPLHVDDRLREICLGAWQGRPWSAIEASDPTGLHHWMSNWTEVAPPGGETVSDLVLRVRSWWSGLPRGSHLLVGHAGVIRALRAIVHGDSWPQAMGESVPWLRGEWFAADRLDGGRA